MTLHFKPAVTKESRKSIMMSIFSVIWLQKFQVNRLNFKPQYHTAACLVYQSTKYTVDVFDAKCCTHNNSVCYVYKKVMDHI